MNPIEPLTPSSHKPHAAWCRAAGLHGGLVRRVCMAGACDGLARWVRATGLCRSPPFKTVRGRLQDGNRGRLGDGQPSQEPERGQHGGRVPRAGALAQRQSDRRCMKLREHRRCMNIPFPWACALVQAHADPICCDLTRSGAIGYDPLRSDALALFTSDQRDGATARQRDSAGCVLAGCTPWR